MPIEKPAAAETSGTVTIADFSKFVQDSFAQPDRRLNQAMAVSKGLYDGGMEAIAEEAQYHPDRLAVRTVTGIAVGAAFGVALTCEAPIIAAAATIGGAYLTGDYLARIGHKLYTDQKIRPELDQVWRTNSGRPSKQLSSHLGPDGRDLIVGTLGGAAGFPTGVMVNTMAKSFLTRPLSAAIMTPEFAFASPGALEPSRTPGKVLDACKAFYMSGRQVDWPRYFTERADTGRRALDIEKTIDNGNLELAIEAAGKNRDHHRNQNVFGLDRDHNHMSQLFEKVGLLVQRAVDSTGEARARLLENARLELKRIRDLDREMSHDRMRDNRERGDDFDRGR